MLAGLSILVRLLENALQLQDIYPSWDDESIAPGLYSKILDSLAPCLSRKSVVEVVDTRESIGIQPLEDYANVLTNRTDAATLRHSVTISHEVVVLGSKVQDNVRLRCRSSYNDESSRQGFLDMYSRKSPVRNSETEDGGAVPLRTQLSGVCGYHHWDQVSNQSINQSMFLRRPLSFLLLAFLNAILIYSRSMEVNVKVLVLLEPPFTSPNYRFLTKRRLHCIHKVSEWYGKHLIRHLLGEELLLLLSTLMLSL
jgi:hypothetical protein